MADKKLLAGLPKVDQVLARPELAELAGTVPRKLVLTGVRQEIEALRKAILEGGEPSEASMGTKAVALAAAARARELARPSLRPLINATGVVVHTNLGRSLLAKPALARLLSLNQSYSNLEYDLAAGRRGSRYSHVANLLCELTGAPAALVLNNNAGAVFLALKTLAQGREVIVSRGQLVEIGGSFRVPDVMAASGATLREVGTTNKTHLADYERAITSETALLLKVHTSNFQVVGFTKEVPLAEMKGLAERYHLPVMEDLGSGCLVEMTRLGLPPEPTVTEALAAGADLVTFSGDKLLGGPQAGIILGRADLVEKIRTNPLNRALRIDKLTLAALEATLELYREPERALAEIPTLALIGATHQELKAKATALVRRVTALDPPGLSISTRDGESRVGGGALPLAAPKTRLVEIALANLSPTALEKGLRFNDPPIISRLEDGRVLLDPRTILKGQEGIIAAAISRLAAGG